MKKNLFILAAALLAVLCSCDNEQAEPVVPTATVEIASSNVTVDYDVMDATKNVAVVTVKVTRNDGYEGDVKVALTAGADATLEAEYYELPAETTVAEATAKLTVTFKDAPAEAKAYTLPLTLTATGENVSVVPEKNAVTITLNVAPPVDAAVELVTPTTSARNNDGNFTLEYKVKTDKAEVKANPAYNYALNTKVKLGETELVKGTDYTVDVETASFGETLENVHIVTLLKPVGAADYALEAKYNVEVALVSNYEHLVVADGKGVSKLNLELYPIYAHEPAADDQIDWNSWNGNNGTHPKLVFDNNDGNWWESCTTTSQDATNGKADRADYWTTGFPAFVGIDFKEELNIHAVCIVGRSDGWGGRVRSCGFRYNWDNKKVSFTDAEKADIGTGQWKPKVEEFEAKLTEWFGEENWFNWDTSYLRYKELKTDFTDAELNHPNGSNLPKDDVDGWDNSIGRAWYAGEHWITLSKDVKAAKIQVWVTSTSWDYFTPFAFGSGSCTNVCEVKIRLATPALTPVE